MSDVEWAALVVAVIVATVVGSWVVRGKRERERIRRVLKERVLRG